MPIAFECEYCGRPTRVADHLAGRRVRCPGCSEAITVDETQLDFIPCGEICCVWSAKPQSSAGPKCTGFVGSVISDVTEDAVLTWLGEIQQHWLGDVKIGTPG